MTRQHKNKTKRQDETEIKPGSIKRVLHSGPQTNRELRGALGLAPDKYDPRLDRKLQQLRKDGSIHIVGQRWALNTVHTCPTCNGRGWVEGKAPAESAP